MVILRIASDERIWRDGDDFRLNYEKGCGDFKLMKEGGVILDK